MDSVPRRPSAAKPINDFAETEPEQLSPEMIGRRSARCASWLAGKHHDRFPFNLTRRPSGSTIKLRKIALVQTRGRSTTHADSTPAPGAPKPLTNRQVDEQLDTFLKSSGALVRVNDAAREFRQIRAFNNRTFDINRGLADDSDEQ